MTKPDLPKLVFSASEVAEMIGMSANWVREQAHYRRVPHVRFGRRIMFRPDDVDAITERFAIEPAPEPEPVGGAEAALERNRDLAVLGLSPRSLALQVRGQRHPKPLRRPNVMER